MASIDSLHTLLVNELRDLLDAEHRITKALPKMIKRAESAELSSALENHLGETEIQVTRLERALEMMDAPVKAKSCPGMKGIIEEGSEHVKEEFDHPSLADATIIGACQRVEHYEIAAYGTAATYAKLLGLDEIGTLLGQSLEEEKVADQLLTQIAERTVNERALRSAGGKGVKNGRNGKSARHPVTTSRVAARKGVPASVAKRARSSRQKA